VKKVVLEARERGVLFDIVTARARSPSRPRGRCLPTALIRTPSPRDVHALCIDGPAFDQVTTMSQVLCMGMPLTDVIAASTVNAAMALRRPNSAA